ncbi:MAG: hypothetical protein IKU77_05165 [Alistipes sp.]|nr:hypothetical protein [Alistipes sp.]
MKKLFKKLLAVALIGAMVGFVGCKDYDDDINALNGRIDGIENTQIKAINEQIASMQSSISSLQSAQTATQNAVSALQATVATLETKADHAADVAALENKIAEAKTALEAAVAAAKAEHAADKAALEAAIEALETAHDADVAALEAEIAALKEVDAAVKAQIAAIEKDIEALEAKDVELAEAIAEIEESMKEMATMTWVEATLEAYAKSEDVAAEIGELWATLTPATLRLFDLESQMTENWAVDEKQQAAIEAAQEALEALETKLDESIQGIMEWVQYEALAPYLTQVAFQQYLTNWVFGYNEDGSEYYGELTFAEIEKQLNALKALVGEISVADAIAQAIEKNNGVLAEEFVKAMEPIKEAIKGLQADVEEIEKQLAATKVNVSALIDRIQSLVYVPEYDDHKASFPVLTVANDNGAEIVAEGKLAMTFQVTPASAAKKLVALGKDVFHYELKEVKTRAAGFGLEIEDVVLGKEHGQFVVIAQTNNTAELVPDMIVEYKTITYTCIEPTLTKKPIYEQTNGNYNPGWPGWNPGHNNQNIDYYEYTLEYVEVEKTIEVPVVTYKAKKSYSVALHVEAAANEEAVEATKSDVVSHYVNLLPYVETLQGITVGADGKVVNGAVNYEITWDDVESKIDLLAGFEPYVMIDGEYMTLVEANKVYNMPELKKVDNSTAYTKDDAVQNPHNFAINHGELYECDEAVSLVKAEKKWLGDYLKTKHAYFFGEDKTPTFEGVVETNVTIIKPTRSIKATETMYYWWNYTDFSSFLKAGVANEEVVEDYEGSRKLIWIAADRSDVNEEVTDQDIVAATFTTQALNAETNKYEKAKFLADVVGAKNGKYQIAISKWAFNKAYKARLVLELPEMNINFDFDAEFIGLPAKLTYDMPEATFAYDAQKSLFVSDTVSMVETLYAAVNEAVAAKVEGALHFADAEEFAASINVDRNGTDTRATADYTAVRDADEVEVTNVKDLVVDAAINANGCYTAVAYINSMDMDATLQLAKKDVKLENDTFTAQTIIMPSYAMPIEINATGAIEMPKFAVEHNPFWVAASEEDYKYFSQVRGIWSPEGMLAAVSSFSTQHIDLNDAFILKKYVDGAWVDATATDKTNNNISFDYDVEETLDRISINADNVMKYDGYNLKDGNSVHVIGTLMVDGVKISKAFTTINDYSAYRVFGFDPIGDFTAVNEKTIETSVAAPSYEDNVISHLSLKDVRDWELIDAAKTAADPWVVGNGNNGFVAGENAGSIFGFSPLKIDYIVLDAAGNKTNLLDKYIKVQNDPAQANFGQVSFSNINEIALQQDVTVTVTVTFTYNWGPAKMGVVNYYLKK